MIGEQRFDELLAGLNDIDQDTRLSAIRALADRHDMRAVKPLLIARRRRETVERTAIMNAFLELGDIAIPALNAIVLRDVNPYLRSDAAYMLGELGNALGLRPLCRAVFDNHELVRALAVAALAKFDHTTIFTPLLIALRYDDSLSVRLEAAIALGNLGDVRAVEALIVAIEDQLVHPQNMPIIINALAATRDPRAVDGLALAAEDRYPNIRAAAATALGKIPDSRAVMVLETLLDDENETVAMAAFEALGRQDADLAQ
jgi:HEAT repeat protein